MHLPSCLSQSTLGDVLGGLYRQRLSGVLQVIAASKTHEIELLKGLVVRVTLAEKSQRLGEVLRRSAPNSHQFDRVLRLALARSADARPLGERLLAIQASPAHAMSEMVQELHQRRLNVLFGIAQAALRFRLFYRPTVSEMVLGPAHFLHHRERHRDLSPPSTSTLSGEIERAYAVLRLSPGAGLSSVRAAFRSMAIDGHPDRFVTQGATAVEHATRRFRECTQSYRLLVAFLSRG